MANYKESYNAIIHHKFDEDNSSIIYPISLASNILLDADVGENVKDILNGISDFTTSQEIRNIKYNETSSYVDNLKEQVGYFLNAVYIDDTKISTQKVSLKGSEHVNLSVDNITKSITFDINVGSLIPKDIENTIPNGYALYLNNNDAGSNATLRINRNSSYGTGINLTTSLVTGHAIDISNTSSISSADAISITNYKTGLNIANNTNSKFTGLVVRNNSVNMSHSPLVNIDDVSGSYNTLLSLGLSGGATETGLNIEGGSPNGTGIYVSLDGSSNTGIDLYSIETATAINIDQIHGTALNINGTTTETEALVNINGPSSRVNTPILKISNNSMFGSNNNANDMIVIRNESKYVNTINIDSGNEGTSKNIIKIKSGVRDTGLIYIDAPFSSPTITLRDSSMQGMQIYPDGIKANLSNHVGKPLISYTGENGYLDIINIDDSTQISNSHNKYIMNLSSSGGHGGINIIGTTASASIASSVYLLSMRNSGEYSNSAMYISDYGKHSSIHIMKKLNSQSDDSEITHRTNGINIDFDISQANLTTTSTAISGLRISAISSSTTINTYPNGISIGSDDEIYTNRIGNGIKIIGDIKYNGLKIHNTNSASYTNIIYLKNESTTFSSTVINIDKVAGHAIHILNRDNTDSPSSNIKIERGTATGIEIISNNNPGTRAGIQMDLPDGGYGSIYNIGSTGSAHQATAISIYQENINTTMTTQVGININGVSRALNITNPNTTNCMSDAIHIDGYVKDSLIYLEPWGINPTSSTQSKAIDINLIDSYTQGIHITNDNSQTTGIDINCASSNSTGIKINIDGLSGGQGMYINNPGSGAGININNTGSGPGINIASTNTNGIRIDSGSSTGGINIQPNNNGATGISIGTITGTSYNYTGINILAANGGTGIAVTADTSTNAIRINHGGNGTALDITTSKSAKGININNSTGIGINVSSSVVGSLGISVEAKGTALTLRNKTASSKGINIYNEGIGININTSNSSTTGIMISDTSSRSIIGMKIDVNNANTTGIILSGLSSSIDPKLLHASGGSAYIEKLDVDTFTVSAVGPETATLVSTGGLSTSAAIKSSDSFAICRYDNVGKTVTLNACLVFDDNYAEYPNNITHHNNLLILPQATTHAWKPEKEIKGICFGVDSYDNEAILKFVIPKDTDSANAIKFQLLSGNTSSSLYNSIYINTSWTVGSINNSGTTDLY